VSLAAALAVPLQTDAGGAFPARDLILFLTLAVIAVTLLLQGLTLPLIARRLVPPDMGSNERRKAQARFQTTEAALAHVGDLSFDADVSASAIERARSMYSERARQLSGACSTGVAEENSDTAAWLELRRKLLDVERGELLRLRNEGRVGVGVMREVQRDLDLEEERLNRVTAQNGSRTPVAAGAA
jgi:CPA1 family monovalent cation:H+ antiporter